MALFGSASRSVKLYFVGDSTGLERTLSRTETRLKRFERVAGSTGTFNSGLLGSFSKGGAIASGAGLLALGLKTATDAAKNSQVILGQTQVAVEDAGLSWTEYGRRVEAASLQIAKSSAFDDEAVLQSFSTFVRGQKDVEKSLYLSQLSADVARGRYTDLATATQLVNKAALGQIGALRRAGIQIDKNATATEALNALQEAYGGAAVKYANTAAGAQDRLRVSVENLQETVGNGALPVLTQLADLLSTSADNANNLASALAGIKLPGGGSLGGGLDIAKIVKTGILATPGLGISAATTKALGEIFGGSSGTQQPTLGDLFKASTIRDRPLPSEVAAATKKRVDNKEPSGTAKKKQQPLVPESLVGRELDARLSRSASQLKGALSAEADYLEKAVAQTKDVASRNELKQALLTVQGEIDSITQAQIDASRQRADDARQAAADARKLAADKARRLKDARRAALDAQGKFLDSLKQGALDALSLQQDKVNTGRELQDALSQLALAKKIGGPEGLKAAQRDVQDAQFARQRYLIESARFTSAGTNTANVQIGSVVLPGIQNPKQFLAELQKLNRRGTTQSRGIIAGRNYSVGIN